jgi:NitT/TauT family transport system permease protein
MKKYLTIAIGPIVILVIWAIVAKLNLIDSFLLPDPFSVVKDFFQLIFSGTITMDILDTLKRVLISFGIAVALGLPLGLFLGRSEKLYRSCEFIVDFFRSTPATAMFPLFLLIFGITDKSKIAVAAFSSMLIIIFNTAYGVMHAKKSRLLAAQIMGATKAQIFKYVLFWESLPQTFIGLRSAVSLSLVVIIVTEMFIGSASGIGRRIIDFQITYEIKSMYAVIILTGIIGYLLNMILLMIERKIVHWNGK